MDTAVSVDCPAVMIEAVLFTWRLLSTNCSDQAAIPTFFFSFQFSVVFPRFLFREAQVGGLNQHMTQNPYGPWGRLGAGSFNSRLRTRISLLLERLLALDHKAIANNQLLGSRFDKKLMLVISCNILWCCEQSWASWEHHSPSLLVIALARKVRTQDFVSWHLEMRFSWLPVVGEGDACSSDSCSAHVSTCIPDIRESPKVSQSTVSLLEKVMPIIFVPAFGRIPEWPPPRSVCTGWLGWHPGSMGRCQDFVCTSYVCHISHIMPKELHLPAASTLRYSLISFGQVLRYSLDGKDAQTIPQANPHGAGMCRVLPGGSTL